MPEGRRPEGEGVYIRQTTSAHVITFIYHLLAGHIELRMLEIVKDVKPTIATELHSQGYKYKSEMVLYIVE